MHGVSASCQGRIGEVSFYLLPTLGDDWLLGEGDTLLDCNHWTVWLGQNHPTVPIWNTAYSSLWRNLAGWSGGP